MRKKLQIYFPIISAVVLFYCTSKALSNEMSNKEYFPDNLSDMQSVWNKRGKGRNVGFSHFDKFSDFYSWILAETLLPLSKQFQILLFAEWLTVQEQLCLNSGLYTEHRLPHWQWFVSIYKCNKTKASDHNIFFSNKQDNYQASRGGWQQLQLGRDVICSLLLVVHIKV